jgi:hypothetical protein
LGQVESKNEEESFILSDGDSKADKENHEHAVGKNDHSERSTSKERSRRQEEETR